MSSHSLRRFALACPAALLALAASAGAAPPAALRAPQMSNLPLTFEKNTGHWPRQVQFVARGGGGALFLTKREMLLSLRKGGKSAALRLKLAGSNPGAAVTGLDKQPGIVNYFIGNDPKQWRTNVPTFSRVKLTGVYPGVDLVYYGAGKSRTLEYDFVVKPGADASRIRMAVAGAKSLRTVGGTLVASTACGDVTLNRPYAYQTVNGVRRQVACSFTLERDTVAFQVARYDASRPLVVDPTLEYSTYVGGNGADYINGVAVDAAGAATFCGSSYTGFPTTSGAYQTANAGGKDAFVAKLNSTGTALVYSTYLGGANTDIAYGVALDAAGAATFCGFTHSSNFPTTAGAYQTTYGGGSTDAFVAKLNPAGTALVYSTFLGGAGYEGAYSIALDAAGAATVCGFGGAGFPTTAGAYQAANAGSTDAFAAKLNSTGTALVYSTYLGGSALETASSVALDATGAAIICGYTGSAAFPTTAGAYQAANAGDNDAFVAKLNPAGTALVYSTFLGGAGNDNGNCVALDATGAVYVCGYGAAGFPMTAGAYQAANAGGGDAFVAKLNSTAMALEYSTYLGGAGDDNSVCVALDASGAATVCGYAAAAFPTTAGAYQTTYGGGTDSDGWVAKLTFASPAPTVTVDDLSATEGTRISLRGRMTDAAGAGIGGKRLQFCIDAGAWVNSEILTSATGYATLTLTAPAAGTHALACRFQSADGIPDGSGSGTLITTTLASTTTSVQDRTAGPGDAVSLAAYLQLQNKTGIAGKQLEFQFNGGSWTAAPALTDAVGKATLAVTAPATAGEYTINARFLGDAGYAASAGTAKLTVAAKRNVYVYTINRSGKVGASGTLIATFYWYQKNGTLTPVSGKSLRFQCAGVGLDSTVVTDASGKATVAVTPATAGSFPFTVTFTADTDYNAGSGSGTLTVAP